MVVLVIDKAENFPLKYLSIPWLETTAEILSVKMSELLEKELDIKVSKEVL